MDQGDGSKKKRTDRKKERVAFADGETPGLGPFDDQSRLTARDHSQPVLSPRTSTTTRTFDGRASPRDLAGRESFFAPGMAGRHSVEELSALSRELSGEFMETPLRQGERRSSVEPLPQIRGITSPDGADRRSNPPSRRVHEAVSFPYLASPPQAMGSGPRMMGALRSREDDIPESEETGDAPFTSTPARVGVRLLAEQSPILAHSPPKGASTSVIRRRPISFVGASLPLTPSVPTTTPRRPHPLSRGFAATPVDVSGIHPADDSRFPDARQSEASFSAEYNIQKLREILLRHRATLGDENAREDHWIYPGITSPGSGRPVSDDAEEFYDVYQRLEKQVTAAKIPSEFILYYTLIGLMKDNFKQELRIASLRERLDRQTTDLARLDETNVELSRSRRMLDETMAELRHQEKEAERQRVVATSVVNEGADLEDRLEQSLTMVNTLTRKLDQATRDNERITELKASVEKLTRQLAEQENTHSLVLRELRAKLKDQVALETAASGARADAEKAEEAKHELEGQIRTKEAAFALEKRTLEEQLAKANADKAREEEALRLRVRHLEEENVRIERGYRDKIDELNTALDAARRASVVAPSSPIAAPMSLADELGSFSNGARVIELEHELEALRRKFINDSSAVGDTHRFVTEVVGHLGVTDVKAHRDGTDTRDIVEQLVDLRARAQSLSENVAKQVNLAELRKRIAALEKDVADRDKGIQGKVDELVSAGKEHEKLDRENKQLRAQLEIAKNRALESDGLRAEVEKMRAGQAALQKKADEAPDLQAQLLLARKALEDEKRQHAADIADIAVLRKAKEDADRDAGEAAQIAAQKIAAEKGVSKRLHEDVRAKDDELRKLREQNLALQSENARLQARITVLERDVAQLKEAMQLKDTEILRLKAEAEEAAKQAAAIKVEFDSVRAQKLVAEQSADDLRAQLEELKRKVAVGELVASEGAVDVEGLKEQLAEVFDDVAAKDQELTDLRRRLDSAEANRLQLVATHEAAAAQWAAEKDRMASRIAELEAESVRYKSKMEAREAELVVARRTNGLQLEQIRRATDLTQRQQARILELEAELVTKAATTTSDARSRTELLEIHRLLRRVVKAEKMRLEGDVPTKSDEARANLMRALSEATRSFDEVAAKHRAASEQRAAKKRGIFSGAKKYDASEDAAISVAIAKAHKTVVDAAKAKDLFEAAPVELPDLDAADPDNVSNQELIEMIAESLDFLHTQMRLKNSMLATRDDIMSTTASRRVDYDALAEIARLRAEKDEMAARMRDMEDEQIGLRALADRRVSRRSLIIEGGEKIHYTQALRKAGEIVFRNEEYKGNAGAKDRAIKRRPGHVARTINNALSRCADLSRDSRKIVTLMDFVRGVDVGGKKQVMDYGVLYNILAFGVILSGGEKDFYLSSDPAIAAVGRIPKDRLDEALDKKEKEEGKKIRYLYRDYLDEKNREELLKNEEVMEMIEIAVYAINEAAEGREEGFMEFLQEQDELTRVLDKEPPVVRVEDDEMVDEPFDAELVESSVSVAHRRHVPETAARRRGDLDETTRVGVEASPLSSDPMRGGGLSRGDSLLRRDVSTPPTFRRGAPPTSRRDDRDSSDRTRAKTDSSTVTIARPSGWK